MIEAHKKDGLALTKFIYWIKNINKKKITEVEAQNKLPRLLVSLFHWKIAGRTVPKPSVPLPHTYMPAPIIRISSFIMVVI